MEDSEFTASMTAFSALVSELLDSGHLETEALISRLRLAETNLKDGGFPVASAALGDYLGGAAMAWRIANTRGLRPS